MTWTIRALAAAALALAAPAAAQEARPPAEDTRPASRAPLRTEGSLELGWRMVEHLKAAGHARPSGRVAVWVGAGNRGTRLSLMETNVPQALWPGLAPLVDAFVGGRREETALELSFYLERLPPPEDAYHELPPPGSTHRDPRLRNAAQLSEPLYLLASLHPAADSGGLVLLETPLTMLVDRRGRPVLVETRLDGDPRLGPYLSALAYRMRFDPALVNGRAIAAWIRPGGFQVRLRH